MNELTYAVLTETELPMELIGWSVLVLSLLVTVVWLAYLYR